MPNNFAHDANGHVLMAQDLTSDWAEKANFSNKPYPLKLFYWSFEIRLFDFHF